jgi:hypothetical protein
MKSVFILWHVREFEDQDYDEKLIGVYATKNYAREAIKRIKDQPGFREHLAGFQIQEYEIGKDHWTEGFVEMQQEGE